MITNEDMILERPHMVGGVQRLYRFKSGYGLSLVNGSMLHVYPFAWEAAVVVNPTEDGKMDSLTYDTELTDDVEVFETDAEADAFIARAKKLFDDPNYKPKPVKGKGFAESDK